MKVETSRSTIVALSLVLFVSSMAQSADKKKHAQRGILESMQSVPCGATERGVTGLGSMFGSVGVQHVNSHEQLCPQYLLRTDEMDYHIRPLDAKHAEVLPVGHEAEFRIRKDRLFLKVPDGKKKAQAYAVVSMQPVNSDSRFENSAYHSPDKSVEFHPTNSTLTGQAKDHPPQQ
jgi:hypothetical protein